MTRPTPEFFQGRIRSLLQRREAELRALIANGNDTAARGHDRTEVMNTETLAEDDIQARFDDALAKRATLELAEIDAARERLGDGSYGSCLSCGEAIDERRLLALPAAPLCARCQADLE